MGLAGPEQVAGLGEGDLDRPAPLMGARPGTPKDLAATRTFPSSEITRCQRTETVPLAEASCLWYGSFRTGTVRVIQM
ncbi:hypothetical protein [Streptomyces sp. MMG1121]|uniref:hypothetical protein n=1 Tax=Streptomyces sp. MMG1121 TaxID=1415544 RepID=UPI0006AE152B|nr:hypothetical protein [Streptomyces sp. MMG1121]KOV64008.1 hypothetical protein ADK64_17830 [Streptomyces sp. MMG1121]